MVFFSFCTSPSLSFGFASIIRFDSDRENPNRAPVPPLSLIEALLSSKKMQRFTSNHVLKVSKSIITVL